MRANRISRLFDSVEYLVDPCVGIIRGVEELPGEPGAPALFYFYAQACNTQAFCAQPNFRDGGGASAERDSAMAKAIGEAIERYCSAIYDRDEMPLESFETAPFECVKPGHFVLHSPEQYASRGFWFVPFTDRTLVRWAPTVDLMTGKTWYVPSAMVCHPYFYDEKHGESPIAQPISTGLACHSSLPEAALSAICEVIERDAFTITWQARMARPQIRVETLSERNRDLVRRVEWGGSSLVLLNITMDVGVPTILAVLSSPEEEAPALVFSAAAHLDPEQATRKSIEEVAHTRRLSQYLKANRPRFVPTRGYSNVLDQDSHLHLYSHHDRAHLAQFIFASPEHMDLGEIETLATGDPDRDLEIVVKKLNSVNHQVLLADLTTPDVRDLGLTVVRAVVPGFHPLFMGHRNRALGGSRLWEIPQQLGYKGITRESGDNPVPHPYP